MLSYSGDPFWTTFFATLSNHGDLVNISFTRIGKSGHVPAMVMAPARAWVDWFQEVHLTTENLVVLATISKEDKSLGRNPKLH